MEFGRKVNSNFPGRWLGQERSDGKRRLKKREEVGSRRQLNSRERQSKKGGENELAKPRLKRIKKKPVRTIIAKHY